MKDGDKTREQLINELVEMRQRIAELEISERERKGVEEALRKSEELRESEAQMKTLLDSLPDFILQVDTSMKILWANETALVMNPDATGQPCHKAYTNREKPCERCPCKKAMDTGQIEMGVIHQPTMKGVQGESYWENIGVPVRDGNGKIVSIIEIARNITKRQRAEEALRESKERLDNFMNSATDGFTLFDPKLNYVDINKVALEMVGLNKDKEKIIGKNILDIVPNLKETGRYDKYMEVIKTGKPFFIEDVIPHHKFGDRYLVVRAFKVGDGLGIIATDITERKRALEYQELNRLKSDLLSTVSHELRTPLATIKGYSTMVLDYDQRLGHDEKQECLQSIDKATDRLTELVDRLLDMSRLEAGLLKMEKEPTSFSKLIQEAVAEAKLRAPRHNMILKVRQRLPRVNIDGKRIRQVLDNLIDNAIKYSQEGSSVVVCGDRVGSELHISVADQGIGIPADDLPRVFDRMYRIKQRLAQDPGGMGLGLSLCKGLVEAHGGRIWMKSEEGKGSKCWFTLPL